MQPAVVAVETVDSTSADESGVLYLTFQAVLAKREHTWLFFRQVAFRRSPEELVEYCYCPGYTGPLSDCPHGRLVVQESCWG